MRQLTHLSLFSGIGGLDLAAEWAGITTVGQCEWADYPTKVLKKHWPDVPRWRDIRTLTGESFYERTGLRTVDVVSGGFPCQPFSTAGKQRGKEDDRYLWPEMVRVIKELRPTWVVGENVAGIIRLALDDVLSDLEAQGYATRTFLLPAHAVGAPHQRYRTAIVAHSVCSEWKRCRTSKIKAGLSQFTNNGKNVSNAHNAKATRYRKNRRKVHGNTEAERSYVCGREWWAAEPSVGRVANGIPNRVDRLKCLGNAVVPQQFYPVFKAIAEVETGLIIFKER